MLKFQENERIVFKQTIINFSTQKLPEIYRLFKKIRK